MLGPRARALLDYSVLIALAVLVGVVIALTMGGQILGVLRDTRSALQH
jgi:hypothetical protein